MLTPLYEAPALLALAVLCVLLATAANWLSVSVAEQVRNSVVAVIPMQGAVLSAETFGWLARVTEEQTVFWCFGVYVLTLAIWWAVDIAEFLSGRDGREPQS